MLETTVKVDLCSVTRLRDLSLSFDAQQRMRRNWRLLHQDNTRRYVVQASFGWRPYGTTILNTIVVAWTRIYRERTTLSTLLSGKTRWKPLTLRKSIPSLDDENPTLLAAVCSACATIQQTDVTRLETVAARDKADETTLTAAQKIVDDTTQMEATALTTFQSFAAATLLGRNE